MPIDPNIAHEARAVLGQYSTPAQEMIKLNLYGPREARFAGAIVANLFTVVVSAPLPTPEERLRELQGQAHTTMTTLCKLLQRAMAVIEESVAGQEDLIRECKEEIASAEDNIPPDDDKEPETKGNRRMNDADTRLDKLGDLIARGPNIVIGTREELHDFVLQLMEVAPQVISDLKNARVPTELFCPMCNHKHVDQGDWEHKIPHRKHQCANCHHIWQPFAVGTVGVAYGHATLPVAEHIQVLERDLAWTQGEWSTAGEEIQKLEKRRDELLEMVAKLSQSVPLDSEVSEALNQRGVLVAEVGTLKATIKTLHAAIEELQLGLRKACAHATTHLPEDREVINEMTRLSHKDYLA